MRYYLLTAALMGVIHLSVAQDCQLQSETDVYTKETKISSGFKEINHGKLTIDGNKTEIDFFFTIKDKCFNDASTVHIYFEGTKTKFLQKNTGRINCNGFFHLIFKNSTTPTSVLKKLATQKVTQFIFFNDNTKQEAIITLTPEEQDWILNKAGCVVTESQKLIKK